MLLKFLNNINEVYSSPNTEMLDYFKKGDFEEYLEKSYGALAKWLDEEEPDYIEYFKELFDETDLSDDEFLEKIKDESIEFYFDDLEPDIKESLGPYIIEYVTSSEREIDGDLGGGGMAQGPTGSMELENYRLLKRTTWLVHFTNFSDSIATNGFKRGVRHLNYIMNTNNIPGYNYAFLANDRSSIDLSSKDYGEEFVMFQNSGVHAYSHGDGDHQIIFWGPDVDPRSIVVLKQILNEQNKKGWAIQQHPLSRHSFRNGNKYIFIGDLHKSIAWVQNNWRQYSKIITGY